MDSFLETHWGQTTHNNTDNGFPCFNLYVPEQYPCGCVATVGAQIMRHWEWPQGGIRPFSRTCWTNDVPVVLQVLATNAYDWASMPFVPGTNETERAAIGRLTHDIAVSVGMRWTPAGGRSVPYVLELRLKDTFGYSNAVPAVFGENHPYSLEEVKRIVVPNCDIRAPVEMAISGLIDGTNYSHAVVVDGYGYSDGAFCMHVNFGWSGLSDAWYFPPAVGEYSVIDGFVFNIFPELTGSIVSGRVLDESGAPVAGAVVDLRGASNVLFQTTSSDAKGVYGFVADPGTYRVSAAWGQFSGEAEATVLETRGTALEQGSNDVLIVLSSDVHVGNSYTNDIVLSGLELVPAPVFEPGSCTFHPSTNVVLSCADPNARIYYTFDGREPTRNSLLYSEPIRVKSNVTIRARAIVTGKPPSSIAEATYVYDVSADAPEGDYFSAPIVLSGESGRHDLTDNGRYTLEENEPYHTLDDAGSCYEQSRTVWHQWTATRSGILFVRTSSEDDDTVYPTAVAVYRGDSLATAERLGFGAEPDENDDWATGMEAFVAAGETYRIVGMMTWNPADAPDAPVSFSLEWALKTETAGAPVPVPYDWLTAHWPESGTDAAACETLALEDADGDGFPAWAEYAANTDPTNAADRLRCDLSFGANGAVTLGVFPETAREGYPRVLQGKVRLDDPVWTDLSAPAEPYRFFRCVIRLSP